MRTVTHNAEIIAPCINVAIRQLAAMTNDSLPGSQPSVSLAASSPRTPPRFGPSSLANPCPIILHFYIPSDAWYSDAFLRDIHLKRSGIWHVLTRDNTQFCLPPTRLIHKWNESYPPLLPSYKSVIAPWQVLIFHPAGVRLSWPGWLVKYQDSMPANGHPSQY